MTIANPETGVAERRSRLRSDITLAARAVPTHYPLETFIAVNPLAGFEALPFEQALRRAGDLRGTRGTLPEGPSAACTTQGGLPTPTWTGRWAAGTPACLPDRRSPSVTATSPRPNCCAATCCTAPERRSRCGATAARRTVRPEVAATVDAQAAKWCAAYFGSAAWSMPGAGRLLRRLARARPADPTLSRRIRARLRSVPGTPG